MFQYRQVLARPRRGDSDREIARGKYMDRRQLIKRGLLGTVFNGYNEDHVRPELKPTIERFRRPDAPVSIDGPIGQPSA